MNEKLEKKAEELKARIENMCSKYNIPKIDLLWLLNDYMLYHLDLEKFYTERDEKVKVLEKLKKYLKEEIRENEEEMKRLEKECEKIGLPIKSAWEDDYYQSVEIRASQTKEILKRLKEIEDEGE